MRSALIVALLTLAFGAAGCGGSDSGSGSLGEAFCNDLQSGYSPFQILRQSVQDGTYSPQAAADLAYGWAAISCPDQLKGNEALRTYLRNWNINSDV